MAYEQPTRFGPAQRPQYQYQESSYAPQQSYTAEFDYASEQPITNSRPPFAPPQQYEGGYGANEGGRRHDYDRWQESNGFQNGRGDYYPARGRHNPEPPQQRPRQPPTEARAHMDPYTREQPRSKSRPPERVRRQEPNMAYESNDYHQKQDQRAQYEPEQMFSNGNSSQNVNGHGFNGSSHDDENGWDTRRNYNNSQIDDQQQYNSRNDARHWRDAPSAMSSTVAPPNHRPPPSNSRIPQHQEPPRSAHGHSTRSESSQRSKASNERIIENPISPDTVAWDNPFPTFPMRPKKGKHSSSQSLDGTIAEEKFARRRHHANSDDNRPQTSSSKSSSYTIPEAPTSGSSAPNFPNAHISPHGHNGRDPREVPLNHAEAYEQPRTANGGILKPPTVQGRHSEDNRTRPTLHTGPNLKYDRSNTMPAELSEAAARPRNQPTPVAPTDWQEPGPVASYYGPEDRGYTPTSTSRERPFDQRRAKSDEKRPYGHAAVPNRVLNASQKHTPQDTLGEVFDNYYDDSVQTHDNPSRAFNSNHYRGMGDEEMPNFDAVPDSAASHRRGLTIDKHLQPHPGRREFPPVPPEHEYGGRSDYRNDAGGQVPRSRSQPNLKDRRSPRDQHNGFDFGVPASSIGQPEASNQRNDYHYDNMPQSADREHFPRNGRNLGGRNEIGNPRDNWNAPPPNSEARPRMYQDRGPSGRPYHPPYNERAYDQTPSGYQNSSQPRQLRSPPPRDGGFQQPLNRPPGARPSPTDRNMDGAPPASAFQNHERRPPMQESRSGEERPKQLDDRALRHAGPSPPPKSPANPDALPAHPAPVRAGLMEGSSLHQPAKPAPVRQYNATPSPMQLSNPSQKPGSSQSSEAKRESAPVTHQELERLRQATARNPSDMATQLVMAKKLAEAAFVLVDERADSRTRAKSREKYNSDALKIVKKLSGNGYIEATFYLADCYTRGSLGLESDTREAFKLYQNAAKAGHAQAAYRVAVCCEIGQEEGGGTSRDPVKAMQWYKRAATLGDTPAMYKMGIISLKGLLGQAKNPREALVWLKRAAERADKENPHALHELALLHEKPNGGEGIQKDEAYSRQLFTQAANLGYKFSQHRLGSAYEYGLLGCPVDPRQSIAWYSKAAVQEEHQSELALSGWYLTGSDGILQQSDTEAYLWARKAAQAGLAKAEYAMGYFTEVGIGASANLEDAKRWYWRAASQNFPKARDRLEDLRKGGPAKRKERVSRSNMRKSTEGECIVM